MGATISVPLTDEEQAALEAEAKAQGLSVGDLVKKAILDALPETPDAAKAAREFNQAFDEIADMIPEDAPVLSDYAMSRESIYSREDEWDRDS